MSWAVTAGTWTEPGNCPELLLEKYYDWLGDFCSYMNRFGTRRSLAMGMRLYLQVRRDLVEIALLERTIATMH